MNTRLTPLKSIKKWCSWCAGGTYQMVENCGDPKCPLFPYRHGNNPARKGLGGKGNPESLKNYRSKTQVKAKEKSKESFK